MKVEVKTKTLVSTKEFEEALKKMYQIMNLNMTYSHFRKEYKDQAFKLFSRVKFDDLYFEVGKNKSPQI
jgi:hypothetical protein